MGHHMSQDTNSLATVENSTVAVDEWWDATDVDEVEGHDLLKDEALYELVGVPFMAFKVIFRDGIQRKGSPWRDDYASVELRVAPGLIYQRDFARIQSRRKSAGILENSAPAMPGEQLVINDGSTGLYRQIVQYLVAKEMIMLPDGDEEGEKGDCIYDLPRSEWISGADKGTEGFEIQLRCSRGLRFSEYSNEYTGDEKARTWYIA